MLGVVLHYHTLVMILMNFVQGQVLLTIGTLRVVVEQRLLERVLLLPVEHVRLVGKKLLLGLLLISIVVGSTAFLAAFTRAASFTSVILDQLLRGALVLSLALGLFHARLLLIGGASIRHYCLVTGQGVTLCFAGSLSV